MQRGKEGIVPRVEVVDRARERLMYTKLPPATVDAAASFHFHQHGSDSTQEARAKPKGSAKGLPEVRSGVDQAMAHCATRKLDGGG